MRFQGISIHAILKTENQKGTLFFLFFLRQKSPSQTEERKEPLKSIKTHVSALRFPLKMVQRKVSNKLGIQAVRDKSNKLLVNLKPSTLQHQEAKNKGADLKKKMKKSRPIKCSDLERLGSPNMRRQVPQPGKPPPPVFSTTAASPQKKSPVKTSETTPNYMRATTSSDARKERSQVSSRNLQTLFDSKISSRKDSDSSKMSSGSVHKAAARILARTSSLKLVRTLTKTTSFKPSRASAKKCSPLVLSENLDVQRATCSSTLKHSKFPAYLALSSGATEAEGTSVMKVCPYTYCSLNGHIHPPPPPLKSFLSARRRLLKTQRSFKLGCFSPRQSKPISSSMEEIQVEQNHEKSSSQEPWDSSMSSPAVEEEQTNFFVRIYSKGRETKVDITDSSHNHISPAVDGRRSGDETPTRVDNIQVLATLSDESPFSEIDSHSNSSKIIDAVSSDNEADYYCEADSSYSTMDLDYAPDSSLQNIQDSDLVGHSPEFGSFIIPEESLFKSDITNRCFGEIQAGIFLKQSSDVESFDKESVRSKAISLPDYQMEDYVEGLDDGSPGELGLQFEDESVRSTKTEVLIDYLKDEIVQDDVEAAWVRGLELQEFHDMIEESHENGMEENEQGDPCKTSIKIEICISLHSSSEATGDKPAKDCKDNYRENIQNGGKSDQTLANMDLTKGTPDHSAHENTISGACENVNCLEENEAWNFRATVSADLGAEANLTPKNACGCTQNDCQGSLSCQELGETCKRRNWRTGCKRTTEQYQELKEFNPREPNFLPLEPAPEAEKVDLKHETMDERKSADEWMLDYAIQKAVNKLGPARKKKVALLVEAFETVMPVTRYDTQLSHSSFPFSHARPIQACS